MVSMNQAAVDLADSCSVWVPNGIMDGQLGMAWLLQIAHEKTRTETGGWTAWLCGKPLLWSKEG